MGEQKRRPIWPKHFSKPHGQNRHALLFVVAWYSPSRRRNVLLLKSLTHTTGCWLKPISPKCCLQPARANRRNPLLRTRNAPPPRLPTHTDDRTPKAS